jgi:hypothetical protein
MKSQGKERKDGEKKGWLSWKRGRREREKKEVVEK